MASPVRVFPLNKLLVIPAEDVKDIKERIDKVKEWVREASMKPIMDKAAELEKLDTLLRSIDKELSEIEFPED